MKKVVIISLLILIGVPAFAQYRTPEESLARIAKLFKGKENKNKYVPDHAFENGGYDLSKYYASFFFAECRLEKFADCDTLAYLKLRSKKMKENEFYFLFLPISEATVILDSVLVKSKERKEKQRYFWFRNYIESTGLRLETDNNASYGDMVKMKIDKDSDWTLFKAKKVANGKPHTSLDYFKYEELTRKKAAAAYLYQRGYDEKGNKRKNLTEQDWLALFKVVAVLLPHVGGQGDTRALFDQIVDPNNTKGQ